MHKVLDAVQGVRIEYSNSLMWVNSIELSLLYNIIDNSMVDFLNKKSSSQQGFHSNWLL